MKSLLLATAYFYMSHPNPPPQVAEHMVPQVLKQAYAMQPGIKKEITITQDNLCYKVALEPIDASALDAFINSEAYKNFRPEGEE
jgi:hypothetical protein